MEVYIIRTKGFPSIEIKRVWELLAIKEGPMRFHLLDRPLFFDKEAFLWGDFFQAMESYRSNAGLQQSDFLIAITELSNAKNWFGAPDPSGANNIFIQGKGWDNFIYCDSRYPIAYETVANVLHREFFSTWDDLKYAHQSAIGCVNDMCEWKPDVTYKFRTADICDSCIQRFRNLGISDSALQQSLYIFSELRQKMLFSTALQDGQEFDHHLPFNVAVTKRKMSSTNEPFKKFLLLIDHFDSLMRTAVIFWSSIHMSYEHRENFFQENGLNNRPSLGAWVNALGKLASQTRTGVQHDQIINQKLQTLVRIADEEQVVSIRNEKRGHGYVDCSDTAYQEIFLKQVPVVNNIEALLKPLFQMHRLYYVHRSSKTGNRSFSVSVQKLESSHAIFQEDTLHTEPENFSDLPTEKHVYLYNSHNRCWHDLQPLMIFDNCPICHHHRLLVVDGSGLYIDPLIGHRVELEK